MTPPTTRPRPRPAAPPPAPEQVLALLQRADRDRADARWGEALAGYRQAQAHYPHNAALQHNIALCHYGLGQLDTARQLEEQAWQAAPQLWQAGLLLARILLAQRQRPRALQVLQQLHAQHPDQAEIRLDLALQTLHQLGDPLAARALVAPLATLPEQAHEARLTTLITELYDTDRSGEAVNADFIRFAAEHLHLPPLAPEPAPHQPVAGQGSAAPSARATPPARLRIGLLSPQFFVSPVYFFSIGALRHLATAAELIFFSRDRKADWATAQLRSLASDWVDVAGLGAPELARQLQHRQLDILIDLGGWMDPQGLRALSAKPAKCLYKWVGGQSITTGIRAFDGFISDHWQTPPGSDALYVEPLVRLPSGYVSYTPPPYLPAPQTPTGSRIVLGVMSNPAKISRGFIHSLRAQWHGWAQATHRAGLAPPLLRFIDRRYAHPALVARLRQALPGIDTDFVVPPDHPAYLGAVGALHAVIDTAPYSGGLTTIEALSMGVPCFAAEGTLFCERHTTAHLHYAGLDAHQFALRALDPLALHAPRPPALFGTTSPRRNHLALAGALFRVFQTAARGRIHAAPASPGAARQPTDLLTAPEARP